MSDVKYDVLFPCTGALRAHGGERIERFTAQRLHGFPSHRRDFVEAAGAEDDTP